VDDGVATGATVIAALRALRAAGAERLVLAVPVAPAGSLERLREADEVVCVATPADFGAVGSFYDAFGEVSDDAVRAALAADDTER
jgi:predicted phosphoribosyltransferase